MSNWDSLVEATIDAVYVDSVCNKICIELTCAWESKDRVRIVATGVDDFVVNEMRLSNIVDRVRRYEANASNGEDLEIARRLFFLMRGEEPSALDLEWPALREKLTRVQKGALALLEIEPVYGATILVLAEDFRIENALKTTLSRM
ncbi:hypothetical protein H6CHR_00519 [Variovorax sp. PBL-H6]|uniref:hypothetical protein n=1 Tax=Variovorax sp. PBL-H6 TaxID=434009 RepID=UPI001315BB8A|nr:hypothetical protein [Variovorax sp. PBL-H6]VTU16428.1 hypothetical protein H6CHR_00519 [Variovorax sp. PBL-H6]